MPADDERPVVPEVVAVPEVMAVEVVPVPAEMRAAEMPSATMEATEAAAAAAMDLMARSSDKIFVCAAVPGIINGTACAGTTGAANVISPATARKPNSLFICEPLMDPRRIKSPITTDYVVAPLSTLATMR